MTYSRREFGRLALAGLPAAAFMARGGTIFGAFTGQTSAKPNSLIDGVQIGTITYSYRSMPDQSGEATLKYILEKAMNERRRWIQIKIEDSKRKKMHRIVQAIKPIA